MSTAENVAEFANYRKRNEGKATVIADTDDGYCRVANQIMDMMCQADLSGAQYRVLNAIVRSTYGYNKKMDRVTNTYLAELTGLAERTIISALTALEQRNIIVLTKSGLMKAVSINKTVSDWVLSTGKSERMAKGTAVVMKAKSDQMLRESDQMLSQDGSNAQPLVIECSATKDNLPNTTNQIQHDLDPPPQAAAVPVEQNNGIARPTAAIQQGKNWGEAVDVELLDKFEALLQQRHPEHYRRPSKAVMASRANTIRLMRTQDERKPEHILALFTIAQFDDFWSKNVLCPNSVRKQWLKLVHLYQEQKAKRKAKSDQQNWAQGAFNPEDPLV
jgi:phage replication O-like protein O